MTTPSVFVDDVGLSSPSRSPTMATFPSESSQRPVGAEVARALGHQVASTAPRLPNMVQAAPFSRRPAV
jgi:hypothetical protein